MKMRIPRIIFLAVFLMPALAVAGSTRVQPATTSSGVPNPVIPILESLDQYTWYGNGMFEFEWTVNEPFAATPGTVIPRNAKQVAVLFLQRQLARFNLDGIDEFVVVGYESSGNGVIQVIFEQGYLSRPILTSELRIHVADRDVVFVTGKIFPNVGLLDQGSDIDDDFLHEFIIRFHPPVVSNATTKIRAVYFPTGMDMLLGFELIDEVGGGDGVGSVTIQDRAGNTLSTAETHFNR